MVRKRQVSEIEIIKNTVFRFNRDLFYSVERQKFAPKNSYIWTELSLKIGESGCMISSLGIYTALIKNYYDLWNLVGIPDNKNDYLSTASSSSVSSNSNSIDTDDQTSFQFSCSFTTEEIKNLEDQANYKRRDISKLKSKHKSNTRVYSTFKKYTWSHVFYRRISETVPKIQCSFSFKRVKIYPAGQNYCKVFGICKECKSKIEGVIPGNALKIFSDMDIKMDFSLSGAFNRKHVGMKRFLTGSYKKQIIKKMTDESKSASAVRNNLASEYVNFGNREPADIPKLTTLRVAKHRHENSTRLDLDVIVSLFKQRNEQFCSGAIKNIGYSPFFVYYWSSSQIYVFRQFTKDHYCKIEIDATGGVANKIQYPNGVKSNYIYLYNIVVRDPSIRKQYCVGSMLSDSHNNISISTWLHFWIKDAQCFPSEIVTDMSLAVIYACIKTFTQFKDFHSYVNACFNVLMKKSDNTPNCYIRSDVAHVVKLFSIKKSLKNQHRLTRKFYLKAIGQAIQCENIESLKSILEAIFIVAYSDTEGVNKEGQPTTCELKKNWLKRRIASGTIESSIESIIETDNENLDTERTESLSESEDGAIENYFKKWVTNIAKWARQVTANANEEGDRGNQQVLPGFVNEIIGMAPSIPLWTSIMKTSFPFAPRIASSASAESYFNHLKNRIFADKKLPMRADDFVKFHLKSIDGEMKLISATSDEYQRSQQKLTVYEPQERAAIYRDPNIDKEVSSYFSKYHQVGKVLYLSKLLKKYLPVSTSWKLLPSNSK